MGSSINKHCGERRLRLLRIHATDFRSYSDATLEPSQSITILHGENGQGKTNLLEAMHFLSTTRGFRSGRDSDLIRWDSEGCQVEGGLDKSGRETQIAVSFPLGGKKQASVDGATLTKTIDIIGMLHTVDFSARDLNIVRGEPAFRREFMDVELAQLMGSYATNLARFKRALTQRNGLVANLAQRIGSVMDLDVWDEHLIGYGEPLISARTQWIDRIAPKATDMHKALSGDSEVLSVTYKPDAPAGSFAQALAESRATDIKRGNTTRGPHRDDIDLTIEQKSVRQFASQGQQRSAALALKLAEAAIAEQRTGETPVILLDDVLSDLDEGRRGRLLELFSGSAQMIMTCTEPGQLPKSVLQSAKLVRVCGSILSEE
jgi:DNA replication and repair protein RecF